MSAAVHALTRYRPPGQKSDDQKNGQASLQALCDLVGRAGIEPAAKRIKRIGFNKRCISIQTLATHAEFQEQLRTA